MHCFDSCDEDSASAWAGPGTGRHGLCGRGAGPARGLEAQQIGDTAHGSLSGAMSAAARARGPSVTMDVTSNPDRDLGCDLEQGP